MFLTSIADLAREINIDTQLTPGVYNDGRAVSIREQP